MVLLVASAFAVVFAKAFPFPVLVVTVLHFLYLAFVHIEPVVIALPVNKTLRAAMVKPSIRITAHGETRTWREDQGNMCIETGRWLPVILSAGTAACSAADHNH